MAPAEIPAVDRRHVAVAFSLPQHHRSVDGCEVEPPRARHEPHVPHGTFRSLAAGLRIAGHEAVADFLTLQQGPVGLGKRRGHSFACAFSTAAHRPEVEPEQTAENGRGIAREPDHHPERRAHRRDDARRVSGATPPRMPDEPNAVRNQRAARGRVRRAAGRSEHRELCRARELRLTPARPPASPRSGRPG